MINAAAIAHRLVDAATLKQRLVATPIDDAAKDRILRLIDAAFC